jgi:uncharacterized membrane protein YtjA (UPF0391 family)
MEGERIMLHYAVVCFVVAILAAMYGFSGIPVLAAEIARLMFFIFIALFLVTLAASGVVRHRRGVVHRRH